MTDHIHNQSVPRGFLLGAALLIIGTVSLAASARASRLAEPAVVQAPRESVEIRFEDRPDGTLAVLDARSGREISAVAPGTNGFIRGVVRGMFRSRKLESVGHERTFMLMREAEGRLTLTDPTTNRRVDLDSFGPTNSAAFGNILAASRRVR